MNSLIDERPVTACVCDRGAEPRHELGCRSVREDQRYTNQ
jgi:hypothetical protein